MPLPRRPGPAFPQPTDRYALGPRDLPISPIALGMVGDPEVVSTAFDAGINFFFLSADMHWPLYGSLRRGLARLLERGVREQLVVGAVSYVAQPDFSRAPLLEILDAVPGLERLDLAIVGGAYGADLLPRLERFRAHQQEGFLDIGAVGASFHDRDAARLAIRHGLVDLAFVRYNPLHPGAEEDLFPHLGPKPSLVYNFKSTQGWLPDDADWAALVPDDYPRPHPTDYYRFAIAQPALDGLLVSLRTPVEVDALVRALAAGPLAEDEERYLRDLGHLAAGRATLA